MSQHNTIHPDFMRFLALKNDALIALYKDLRTFILDCYPEANELLYHTHALTSLYTVSTKMSDAFCMIPIYTNHLNLAFNKGTLLTDRHNLLQGTGKYMRHIPITQPSDYRNNNVQELMKAAIALALEDMDTPTKVTRQTISKIKSL